MSYRSDAEKRWSQALIEETWEDAFWNYEFSPDPRCLVLEETRDVHGSTWRGLQCAPFVDELEALIFLRFAYVPGTLHEMVGGSEPVEFLEQAIGRCDAATSRWLADLVAALDEAVAVSAASGVLMGSIRLLFDGAFRATNPRLEVVHWGSLRAALGTRQCHDYLVIAAAEEEEWFREEANREEVEYDAEDDDPGGHALLLQMIEDDTFDETDPDCLELAADFFACAVSPFLA